MKRIVMIVGGKGGTGKTALTRLEVDELHTQGIKYIAYDADTENPELYEYYKDFFHKIYTLNIFHLPLTLTFFFSVGYSIYT